MFKIKKTFEVAIAHRLNLSYTSPCSNFHGHNLKITVYCACSDESLNENGMVIDFTIIKELVGGVIDHRCLNDIEGIGFEIGKANFDLSGHHDPIKYELDPTAENLAQWICLQIDTCYRVDVQESEGNIATYIDDSVKE